MVSEIAGAAVFGFAFFNTIQFLFYECIYSMLPPVFSCYLGLHPLFIPPLYAVAAALLGVGFLADRRAFPGLPLPPPPGLISILLGAGLVELGTLYVYDAANGRGWDPVSVWSVLFPIAGVVLVSLGAARWWRWRESQETPLRSIGAASPAGLPGRSTFAWTPREPSLFAVFQAVAIALVAAGVVAVLVWATFVACPWCETWFFVGDPAAGEEVIAAGVVMFLVSSAPGPRRTPRGLVTGIEALETGLGGAVVALIPTVVLTAKFNFTVLSWIYALLLLVSGGVLWAEGARLVS